MPVHGRELWNLVLAWDPNDRVFRSLTPDPVDQPHGVEHVQSKLCEEKEIHVAVRQGDALL